MTGWERLARRLPHRLTSLAKLQHAELGANVHEVRRVVREGLEVWRCDKGVARLRLDDLDVVVRLEREGLAVTQVALAP